MMYFVIVTYTITVLIYLFFPTCQNLRPEAFVRNNLLTRFIELFYSFDTNTNVCPSLHVIGSVAAMFGLWDCKALQSVGWKIAATSIAVCISLSTVFMKQHSIMDVLAACQSVSLVGGLPIRYSPIIKQTDFLRGCNHG